MITNDTTRDNITATCATSHIRPHASCAWHWDHDVVVDLVMPKARYNRTAMSLSEMTTRPWLTHTLRTVRHTSSGAGMYGTCFARDLSNATNKASLATEVAYSRKHTCHYGTSQGPHTRLTGFKERYHWTYIESCTSGTHGLESSFAQALDGEPTIKCTSHPEMWDQNSRQCRPFNLARLGSPSQTVEIATD